MHGVICGVLPELGERSDLKKKKEKKRLSQKPETLCAVWGLFSLLCLSFGAAIGS